MKKLRIRDFLPRGVHIHFARTRIDGEGPFGFHTHDFFEFFCIDAGQGVHHINGQAIPLVAGQLVFVRDRDRHGFSGQGLVISNAAFPRPTFKRLANRYFAGQPAFYNERSSLPYTQVLDPVLHAWFKERMDRLAVSSKDVLETDLFLLDVFRRMSGARAMVPGRMEAPAWVASVCEASRRPDLFVRGTRALAEWAGRTPEHVSRELKRWTGRGPADWIAEARLQWAAQRLTTSAATILEISLECGYESLGHFYGVFKRRYGLTPRKFRMQSRRIAGL